MKTIRFIISIILFSHFCQGQVTDTGDKVGIGNNSPNVKLHIEDSNGEVVRVESSANSSQIMLKATGLGGIDWSIMSTANGASLGGGKFSIYGNAQHRFVINQNGFIGVGATTPIEKLHIENGALQFYNLGPDQDNVDIIKMGESTIANEFSLQGMFYGTGATGNAIKFRSMWEDNLLVIRGNGGIGIGTTTTGTHKLAVEGTIGAREIKVEAGTWSDFVFHKDYPLPTLAAVEIHIKENGHLKDIPSEAEVKANGINLGEMDAKLLQKIEELTLYTIEQQKLLSTQAEQLNKQKQSFEEQLSQQEKLIEKLVKRIETLENN